MAVVANPHVGPWSEEDLLGLPEDGQRYELLEGALLGNPPPGGPHQRVSFVLTRALDDAVPAGLIVVEAMGVRLPEHTMFIPDVLVAERRAVLANSSGILDPGVVVLVVEIVSPGSRTSDRLTKPSLYARAGIPSFWRVELEEGPGVLTYGLDEGAYVETASARPGQRLVLDQPFPVSMDPGDLRP